MSAKTRRGQRRPVHERRAAPVEPPAPQPSEPDHTPEYRTAGREDVRTLKAAHADHRDAAINTTAPRSWPGDRRRDPRVLGRVRGLVGTNPATMLDRLVTVVDVTYDETTDTSLEVLAPTVQADIATLDRTGVTANLLPRTTRFD